MNKVPWLWTIGHSNHTLEWLVALLSRHGIASLVDVRSAPYSRFAPHFNQAPLREVLERSGVSYTFAGRELGGRPEDSRCYDAAGHVRYDLVADLVGFRDALATLERELLSRPTAVLCGEEDPTDCHRRLLVGKALTDEGRARLRHIRGDASLTEEPSVDLGAQQLSLLGEEPVWRSTRSVSPRSPRDASSGY